MKMSFLYGAKLSTLWRLLRRHGFRVSWKALPDLLLHLFMAVLSSLLSIGERFRSYPNKPEKPVFIIGHWRSGTTHLHNLLTMDGAYHSPNTFQAAFPHIFLKSERWLAPLLDAIGPGKRLMDNMTMVMGSPQEEEIALAALGAPSSYLAIHFPKGNERYRQFVSLKDAAPTDVAAWKQAHRRYLGKLLAKFGPQARLVLKSPANTARIPLLLELYPDARFIHSHRQPEETIRSTLHLSDARFRMTCIQSLDELKRNRDRYVLDAYEEMHRRWLADKSLIPPDRLLVLGFDELKQDPISCVEQVYSFLGDATPDTDRIRQYLQSIKSYRQNRYDPLSEDMKAEIRKRMGFVFEEFGYGR